MHKRFLNKENPKKKKEGVILLPEALRAVELKCHKRIEVVIIYHVLTPS
jgi:hypothetical protein